MYLDRLDRLDRNTGSKRDRNRYRKIAEKYVRVETKNHLGVSPTGCAESAISDKSQSPKETFSNPPDLNEVLPFPVRLLGGLYIPPLMVVEVSGFDITVVLDFRMRSTWRRSPTARPTFELSEIEALTEAAENGRVRPRDFVQWCQKKQSERYWCLTRETALEGTDGPIKRPPEPKNWNVGRLLNALDAKLLSINIVYQGAKTAAHGPCAEATQ